MTTAPHPNSACAVCGAPFECAMGPGAKTPSTPPTPDLPCWCFALPHGLPVPGSAAGDNTGNARCLCAVCLRRQLLQTVDATAQVHPASLPKYPPNRSGAL